MTSKSNSTVSNSTVSNNTVSNNTVSNQNVVWQDYHITRKDREKLNGHHGAILWFTGLSGSGKSTLAQSISTFLFQRKMREFVLDGDNIRHGLCNDLGFSVEARQENIRRIGEVANLFVDSGCIVLTAFISPFQADRDRVRALVNEGDFFEIYCKCPVEVCEQRDVKGLYKKARAGEIPEFTGISSPYEIPTAPDLVVNTELQTLEESVMEVINFLAEKNVLPDTAVSLERALS